MTSQEPGEGGDHGTVRRATPGDESIVRSVRLDALADAPDDFDSTLERELRWTTSDWQKWLSRGATFVLEGLDGGKGIAAGVPNRNDPEEVFLMSMWVHPELRGTGVADKLVAPVLSWSEAEGATGVWLHVVKDNNRARRFYARNGFRLTGREVVRERDGTVEMEMHHPLDRRLADVDRKE